MEARVTGAPVCTTSSSSASTVSSISVAFGGVWLIKGVGGRGV
jgi:hypothetical protein